MKNLRELTPGQQHLVEEAIRTLLTAGDPTRMSHHLRHTVYFCSWSHRVRQNLLVVYRATKRMLTFLSTGTHAQAYRPRP